jgi:ABC-type transport system involved in multi-copper enzyme maturation permease subunit
MMRAIRAEILKLRTVRLALELLAAAMVVTLLVALLEFARAGGGHGRLILPSLNGAAGQTVVLTSTEFALLLALVLGVTITTGEFHHGTATATALAIPDRVRVLVAKAIVATGGGLVFGLAAALVATVATLIFVASKGFTLEVPTSTILRYGAGAMLACGLLAAAGAAVGALIRSQLAAIVVVLLWGLVAEPSLGALFPTGDPFFPYTAASTLAGKSTFAHGVTALPFFGAALLVLGVAILLGVVAARTTVPRDIA